MKQRAKSAAGQESTRLTHSASLDFKDRCEQLQSSIGNLVNNDVLLAELNKAYDLLWTTVKANGTIFLAASGTCNNEAEIIASQLLGSMDALTARVNAVVLGGNRALLSLVPETCSAEDLLALEFDHSSRTGDCLWLLSVGGGDSSLINVATAAKNKYIPIITCTGYPGSPLASFGQVKLRTPVCGSDAQTARSQELQKLIYNTLCYRLKLTKSLL